MRKKIRITLFMAAGMLFLTGVITPSALAKEGMWGLELTKSSFLYWLGPQFKISTTSTPLDADRHLPALAYNYKHQPYLIVWHNKWPGGSRDIYAQRVSESGQPIGNWFCITTGTENRLQPAVAYSVTDDEYLIAWMKEVSTDVYEIWGRIVAWNGSYMGPEFKIISWTDRSFWTPRVVWNVMQNEYMVVWNAYDTSGGLPGVARDITGARITNQDGGKVIATHMLAFPTDSGPHQVDIAYNIAMNEYLMVCVIMHTEASSGNDIYGRRVNWDGTPGTWIEIYKDDYDGGRKHQNHPTVATNDYDKYIVVWEHEYEWDDHDIYGREYNTDGTPVGASFAISSWTEDDTAPDAAANGLSNEWSAVWQREIGSGGGYSIHGYRYGFNGSPVYTYSFDVINWAFYECKNPAVAVDFPGYLIVYEELAPPGILNDSANLATSYHIYGRVWSPEAVYQPVILKNSP